MGKTQSVKAIGMNNDTLAAVIKVWMACEAFRPELDEGDCPHPPQLAEMVKNLDTHVAFFLDQLEKQYPAEYAEWVAAESSQAKREELSDRLGFEVR
jgi:hypothetical protein